MSTSDQPDKPQKPEGLPKLILRDRHFERAANDLPYCEALHAQIRRLRTLGITFTLIGIALALSAALIASLPFVAIAGTSLADVGSAVEWVRFILVFAIVFIVIGPPVAMAATFHIRILIVARAALLARS